MVLGVSFNSLSTFFTKDTEVLKIIATGILVRFRYLNVFLFPFSSLLENARCLYFCETVLLNIMKLMQFVSASQPINALAFIFDGLHYGASDFPYAARSMVSPFPSQALYVHLHTSNLS